MILTNVFIYSTTLTFGLSTIPKVTNIFRNELDTVMPCRWLSSLCHCTLWDSGHQCRFSDDKPAGVCCTYLWQLKVTQDSHLTWQNSGGGSCSERDATWNRPLGGIRHQIPSVEETLKSYSWFCRFYAMCPMSHPTVMKRGSGALLDLIWVNDSTKLVI